MIIYIFLSKWQRKTVLVRKMDIILHNLKIILLSLLYLFAVILILLDQASKYFFGSFLANKTISIIGDFVSLRITNNTGIAFSLPIEGLILKLITIWLIAAIGWYYFQHEKHRDKTLVQAAYTLILSGAISNGIERVFFGKVVDFIAVKYFAIFNFADIFISVGAILLFFFYYSYERNTKHHK